MSAAAYHRLLQLQQHLQPSQTTHHAQQPSPTPREPSTPPQPAPLPTPSRFTFPPAPPSSTNSSASSSEDSEPELPALNAPAPTYQPPEPRPKPPAREKKPVFFGPRQRQSVNHDVGKRITILALYEAKWKSGDKLAEMFDVTKRTIQLWAARAKERGHIPGQAILLKHLEDAPRSGRPTIITEQSKTLVKDLIRKDHDGRYASLDEICSKTGIKPTTLGKLLKQEGFRKVKPTYKPGLTKAMRDKRLEFCNQHKDWTIEDWKNVIWTDETSVILGSRRGAHRVWRTSDEYAEPTVIRRRFKGRSEFMWWSCFSYDHKGPYHIWKKETAAEKRAATEDLKQQNEALEPAARLEWELVNGTRRLRVDRRNPGRAPQWKFTAKTGALVRSKGKGGIDWYRYQKCILYPKLIPFAKECLLTRPNTIVMEDGAPAHASKNQDIVWSVSGINKLLWPGNSPDLNAIEPCWYWMKRETTKRGSWSSRKKCEEEWVRVWQALSQERIQAWITRIYHHVHTVIDLEGGNEYKEGTEAKAQSKQRLQHRSLDDIDDDWVDLLEADDESSDENEEESD